eukprot:4603329-Pleurochrysis_carterae.AAC.1
MEVQRRAMANQTSVEHQEEEGERSHEQDQGDRSMPERERNAREDWNATSGVKIGTRSRRRGPRIAYSWACEDANVL